MMFPSLSLMFDNAVQTGFVLRSFYWACIPAQSESTHTSEALLPARGRYQIERVKIVSRYPFGFFVKGREYPVNAECICYPQLMPSTALHLAAVDLLGSEQRVERGLGNDLYMIRNYLHPTALAMFIGRRRQKTATLKTREFAAEESRRLTLYLDRFARSEDSDAFERLVSYTASLAVHLAQEGIEIALATDEWRSPFGSSESHIDSILRYLALVQSTHSLDQQQANDGTLMLSLRRTSSTVATVL